MPSFSAGAKTQLKAVQVNGAELHYQDCGSGQPVVLVHGSLSDYRFWAAQVESLSQRFRVISYSRRYHVPNRWPDSGENYTLAVHVADLAGLIQFLGLGRVHLAGYSSGGWIAAATALEHPELLRSLALIEPGIYSLLPDVPERAGILRENAETGERVREALSRGDEAGAARFILEFFLGVKTWSRLSPEIRDTLLENAPSFRAQMRASAIPSAIAGDDIRRLKTAVLLVGGESSRPEFRLILDELERCLANCKRVRIAGAGHGLIFEAPQQLNKILSDFLAEQA